MYKTRQTRRTIIALLPLILVVFYSAAVAQNRERFTISAKAGAVNNVVGRVMVTRQGQESQLLSSTDDLAAKDVVTTGTSSNAEILLNPGSYLRLAENSEFQFDDISLDHLKLSLTKGSAIIEATGVADMDLGVKVATPNATFTIIRSGIYRINVEQDASELAVYKGRANYGANQADVLKGGNSVRLSNGVVELAKVPQEKDAFGLWSKQRAQLLARANERLSRRALNGYLNNHSWDSPFWGPTRFGLWTFNASFGCYTFLPFYYGWSSPYGHYYGSYFWRGGYYGNGPSPIIVNNGIPAGTHSGTITPGGSTGNIPTVTGVSGGPSPGAGSNGAPRDPDSGGRAVTRLPRDPQP
jgi:FecR-like protein